MYTQCPKCLTIFEVSEEILAIKEGLVRCGDCENVFNATWNMVDNSSEEYNPPSDNQDSSPPLSHDEDEVVEFANDSVPETHSIHHESESTTPFSEFDDPEDAPFENPIVTNNSEDFHTNEHTYNRYPHVAGKRDSKKLTDSPENNTDTISDAEIRRTLKLDEALEFENNSDEPNDTIKQQPLHIEPPLTTHIDEIHQSKGFEQHQENSPTDRYTNEPLRAPINSRTKSVSDTRIEPRLGPITDELIVDKDDALQPSVHLINKPMSRPRVLNRTSAIQPNVTPRHKSKSSSKRSDPNVHWQSIPDQDRQKANFIWAIGVLLALVFTLFQVRFIIIEDLFAIPSARPFASLFCEFTGCKAPQRVDPGSINIAQTRVDLHPEIPGALRIKINLINRADYPQPYPPLQITLSDKDGRIVGRRTYHPDDYHAETDGDKLLDPGILDIATLNLAHPNENAVGFETIVVN